MEGTLLKRMKTAFKSGSSLASYAPTGFSPWLLGLHAALTEMQPNELKAYKASASYTRLMDEQESVESLGSLLR